MNDISVQIQDKEYTDFLVYDFSENIESLIKEANFTLNLPSDNNLIKKGDRIVVKIDNEPFFTGYADTIKKQFSSDKFIISVECKDKLFDLATSRIGAKIYKTPISFIQLVKNVLTEINFNVVESKVFSNRDSNITIINNFGDIPKLEKSDDVSHRDNDTAFEVIKRCADKRQLILTSDGEGNLLINKIGIDVAKTILLRAKDSRMSNVLDSSVVEDNSNRYYKYVIKSISTVNQKDSTGEPIISPFDDVEVLSKEKRIKNTINSVGIAYDNEIRKTRIFTDFRQLSSIKKAQDRAEWEANIRKAQSFQYSCEVFGFRQNLVENIKINKLWKVNHLVDVEDEICNIFGRFLIKSVNYKKTLQGTRTLLTLVNEKAYTNAMFEPISRQVKGIRSNGGKTDSLIITPL